MSPHIIGGRTLTKIWDKLYLLGPGMYMRHPYHGAGLIIVLCVCLGVYDLAGRRLSEFALWLLAAALLLAAYSIEAKLPGSRVNILLALASLGADVWLFASYLKRSERGPLNERERSESRHAGW